MSNLTIKGLNVHDISIKQSKYKERQTTTNINDKKTLKVCIRIVHLLSLTLFTLLLNVARLWTAMDALKALLELQLDK